MCFGVHEIGPGCCKPCIRHKPLQQLLCSSERQVSGRHAIHSLLSASKDLEQLLSTQLCDNIALKGSEEVNVLVTDFQHPMESGTLDDHLHFFHPANWLNPYKETPSSDWSLAEEQAHDPTLSSRIGEMLPQGLFWMGFIASVGFPRK